MPERKHKTYPVARFKQLTDGEPEGTFEALVSVFGNVDYAGDVVIPGAFANSIERWREQGDPVPIIFSHRWDDLDAHIGYADPSDMQEIDDGLLVKGHLDLEDAPSARRVWQLMSRRTLREFSFAYDVLNERPSSDGKTNELHELDVIEVGPTLKGMNNATQLVDIKSAPQHQTRLRTVERRGKAVVSLAGSIEQRLATLHETVVGWATALVAGEGDELYTAGLEATYDDHAIAYVETWSDPLNGGRYFEVPYSIAADGVELGEATEVAVEGVVVPKSAPAAGVKHQITGPAAKLPAKLEEPDRAKSEEPAARSSTPATLLARLEVEALELNPV